MGKASGVSDDLADGGAALSLVECASESIGRLQRGSVRLLLTWGQFSLIDMVEAICLQVGPSRLSVCTWTVSHENIERISGMMDSGLITDFRMMLDRSFPLRPTSADTYAHLQNAFPASAFRYVRTHAKFVLVRAADQNVVIAGSANLNENPLLEVLVVMESEKFGSFVENVFDGIWSEVDENVRHSGVLRVPGVSLNQINEIERGRLDPLSMARLNPSFTLARDCREDDG